MQQHDPANPNRESRLWWMPLVLIGVGVAVYWNSLGGAFVFDDLRTIVDNPRIRSLGPLSDFFTRMSRPMVQLSLALNYRVGEVNPLGYHVVNMAIHVLASLALFGIVRRTLLTQSLRERYERSAPWLALTVAMIWLVHPLQTQAVTYVIQRSESLMGLFYLVTLYCVIRAADGRQVWPWTLAAVAACALGMGTKEVMVTAPLVILLYDRTFLADSFASALRRRAVLYGGLTATWAVLFGVLSRGSLLAADSTAGFGLEQLTALQYAQTQPMVILHYLRLSFWPHPLCFDYFWFPAQNMDQIVPAFSMLVLLFVATAWAIYRRSWLGFVGAWFFLILAPTSSVMPIFDLAVEHRMYLSLAAPVVLVVLLAHHVVSGRLRVSRPVVCIAVITVVGALGYSTIRRHRVYESPVSLWQSVVEVEPDNIRGLNNLGLGLLLRGKINEGLPHLQRAVQLAPGYASAHGNLGRGLVMSGRFDEGIPHIRRSIDLAPDSADAHCNLGDALLLQGDIDGATQHINQALQLNPDLPAGHNSRAALLIAQGKYDQAIAAVHRALALKPHMAKAYGNLGIALARQQRMEAAIVEFRRAVELAPYDAEAHHNLALALRSQGELVEALQHFREATTLRAMWPEPWRMAARVMAIYPDSSIHSPPEAVRFAEQAVQLTGRRSSVALDTLAMAYAAAGRFDLAVSTTQAALQLLSGARQVQTADMLQRRLELYRQNKAYRQALPSSAEAPGE